MALARQIELSRKQRAELEETQAHHPKPYMRERASAILKVAGGHAARQVALTGLLHPRDPETIATWLDRYLVSGLAGLQIHEGRGRKPAFFPPARPSRKRSG